MKIHMLSILSAVTIAGLTGTALAGPISGVDSRTFAGDSPAGLAGLDALRFDGDAVARRVKFEAHTDVPELPRGGVTDLPGFGSVSGERVWNFQVSSEKPLPSLYFGGDARVPDRIFEELRGGDGLKKRVPVRVHTDVPDLPGAFGIPNTSADPLRKPGWGDWTDLVHDKPQLESATVPTPGSAFVLMLGGLAAARRRRRG